VTLVVGDADVQLHKIRVEDLDRLVLCLRARRRGKAQNRDAREDDFS
jgi:hypothetical protein